MFSCHSNDATRKQAQPLQNPLTYIVFENVDIARPNDANYDSIAALCKVLLETDYYNTTPCRVQYVQLLEQSRWMGYVRLKLREPTPAQQRSSSRAGASRGEDDVEEDDDNGDDGGIYTDGSSGYSTAGTGTINSGKSTSNSNSSSDRGSWAEEGDYDHVYIARLNTQRPVEELKMLHAGDLQRNVLPEACVCRLASCLPAWAEHSDDEEDEDEDEDEEEDEEEEDDDELEEVTSQAQHAGYETVQVLRQCRVEQQRRRALLQQCYLSSERFMHYFGELLRQQLAHELGISQRQLAAGSYRGCSIYTSTDELVPAIHVPHGWPDCAFEFNLRARPQLTNLHTGEKFQWPTCLMRKRIQSFGFHVVPVGYAPKRARNPFRQLEWRIVFPQAEQYLERLLTRMQLKVLLLMKALVRTFVNDKCQAMGHIMEQLRTHLFWECERHSNDWPEEFLGDRLVRFVRSFADCLARKQLSDYFIERRNLFEHVPEDALMELRSIMAGIAEQPLLHVLQALRNLQHAPDFYPRLNYGQLLETLVMQEYQQLRVGSKFARTTLPVGDDQGEQQQKEQTSCALASPSDAVGLLGMWRQQEQTGPRGKLRRKTQMLRAQQQQQQLKQAEQRRHSADSTSGPWSMPLLLPRMSQTSSISASSNATSTTAPALNNSVEILRRTNLLEQLMDHMLAMLAKATDFRNAQHAQLYLDQAQLLCRLYKQLGCDQHAQHYAEALCQAASNLERSVNVNGAEGTQPNCSPGSQSRSSSNSLSRCSPMRRKSLKFVEHVVQMHSGEVIPLQGGSASSSSSLTRKQSENSREENLDEILVANSQEEEEMQQPTAAKESVPMLESLLQRMQVDPSALQTISSKTEQLMQTLAPEAKRDELRNMLKRNTQKLKSAFS